MSHVDELAVSLSLLYSARQEIPDDVDDAAKLLEKMAATIRRYLKAERALRDAQSSPEWQKKFPGLEAVDSPEVQEKVAAFDALRKLVN